MIQHLRSRSGLHSIIFGESKGRQIGDRFVELIESFNVILAPLELFDEDVIMKLFVAAVNIASDDTECDGVNGYKDKELFEIGEAG
jgi:hypothetical protein